MSWTVTVKWAARTALSVLLAIIAFAIAVLIVIPLATRGSALTVETGSMTPTLPVGSVVIDRPVAPAELQVGDIATYQKPDGGEFVTHRVAAIDMNGTTGRRSFTFKGDANRTADPDPVPPTAIRGKVWFHVPYLGAARDALHATAVRAAGLGLLALILAGYVATSVARKRRENPEQQMTLRFEEDAFGDVDPATVASVLGATLNRADEQHDGNKEDDGNEEAAPARGVILTLTGTREMLAAVRTVVARYDPEDITGPASPAPHSGEKPEALDGRAARHTRDVTIDA